MSLALCWLAAAVWLSGGRPRPTKRVPVRRRRLSGTALGGVAAVACVVLAVAVLGPALGVVAGMITAPLAAGLAARLHARDAAQVRDGSAHMVPLVLDVLASALRSGQPVAPALAAVAPLAGENLGAQLHQVAGMLRFGADPATAWRSLSGSALASVVTTACRSAESGIRLARGFELLAAELRDEARAAALARAHRAGVWAMAPLGLCFLPAFACLGVLPIIVGVAHGVLSGGPR